MISPITNHYNPATKRPALEMELVTLYEPQTEAEWLFCHHPYITHFKGRFYAMWSNGRRHEDDLGQRVMMATSDDFYHWTTPEPLIDATMGKESELVLTAGGFHQHNGTLAAYYGQWEFLKSVLEEGGQQRPTRSIGHTDTGLSAVITTDGKQWSEPVDIGIPLVPNHGPQATASGRLIFSGNIMFPYSDDPSGLSGWHLTGLYPDDIEELWDDSQFHGKLATDMGWPVGVCEGSFYQTPDGVIHMLLRSSEKRLWVSESHDDGESWSPAIPTHFTDCRTKFHMGVLPDGRFYYVGSPDPDGERRPLVLSISEDGIHFRRHFILGNTDYTRKFPGMHKGGVYGYPHTLLHDGMLYVIVSIRKEQVMVLRTPIETI